MPVPRPPVPLTDICSVVYNNTLYTYSAGAFQSLALEPGAEWKKLASGVSVTGAACVGSTPIAPREPGFFVVGGKGPADYRGLQKFTYSTGKWESFAPTSGDVKDRVWHGAAYINSTDAILVYAGTQDGSKHSSTQTFTVGASAPYDVLSKPFTGTPPATNPIVLPWSDREAALIGGSDSNNQVMLFSTETGWRDSGVSLASPLTSAVRAVIIAGDDGSKSLYTFDMSQSPNKVTRTVLINGQKQPVANSQAVTARSFDDTETVDGLEKRLTSDQWPKYNATNAPKVTRTNYAVAQDANGRVVVAGGSDTDALCVFDGRENKWLDASTLFNAEETVRTTDFTSSSLSTTASATATSTTSSSTTLVNSSASPTTLATSSTSPTPTGTSAPVGAGADSSAQSSSSNPPINAILGAVLGTTAMVLLLLGILYCLLRRKKQRQEFLEAGHARRASGAASTEKGGTGYANDSLPTPTNGVFRGHQQQDSHASFSSMAILMGKAHGQKQATIERQPSKDSKRNSSGSILNSAFKKSISKPIPQAQDANPFADPKPFADPNPFADPTSPIRSPLPLHEKGVAFSGDVAEPKPRASKPDGPEGPRRSSGWNRYWSGGSTLNILGFGNGASKRTSEASSRYSSSNAAANRITQDSATVPHLNVGHLSGPKPEFNRVNSGSPTISHYTPHKEMQGRIERPMSQESGSSGYSSGIPASVHEEWDATGGSKPWGSVRAPSSAYTSVYSTAPPLAMGSNAPRPPPLPSGVSSQPQLAMASTSSDMSWLNLGDNRRV
ncbi:hypothetical protein RB595_009742 [Gaeumannomyces hyphopodioides]